MNKTGNIGMCGNKHWYVGNGKYCVDCGHRKDADCHMNPQKFHHGELASQIATECSRATELYGAFHSTHEGLAIILEEYEELKKEVFKKQSEYDMVKMRREATHLGAMALRFINDLCDQPKPQ